MNHIKKYRETKNITQTILASDISDSDGSTWTQSRLSNYENGNREITVVNAYKVLGALRKHKIKCKFTDVFPDVTNQPAANDEPNPLGAA